MTFEIKAYPEIWQSLDMDVERFDKARLMLGEAALTCEQEVQINSMCTVFGAESSRNNRCLGAAPHAAVK